jgi:hypothetical protein
MTRTLSAPDLRPLPRFTFAGRGCRDPRREPRRLPEALRTRPASAATVASQAAGSAPVAEALAPAADRRSGTTRSTSTGAARDDHPPPAALRYGPGRGGHRKG